MYARIICEGLPDFIAKYNAAIKAPVDTKKENTFINLVLYNEYVIIPSKHIIYNMI